jgi:hypothetical protein
MAYGLPVARTKRLRSKAPEKRQNRGADLKARGMLAGTSVRAVPESQVCSGLAPDVQPLGVLRHGGRPVCSEERRHHAVFGVEAVRTDLDVLDGDPVRRRSHERPIAEHPVDRPPGRRLIIPHDAELTGMLEKRDYR